MATDAEAHALFAANVRLAYHLAGRLFGGPGMRAVGDATAVRQEALVGLWRAALAFDPARGKPFAALARRWVVGTLLHACRRDRTPVSVPEYLRGGPGSWGARRNPAFHSLAAAACSVRGLAGTHPAAGRSAAERGREAREAGEAVASLLARLPAAQAGLLRAVWLEGATHAELAASRGVTRQAVSTAVRRALRAARALLDGEDW